MKKALPCFLLTLCTCISTTGFSQKSGYNYAAQQKLIPAELGAVFLGMDLKSFTQKIKLDSADIDDRFEEVRFEYIPFKKDPIETLWVKFSGLSDEQKAALSQTVTVMAKSDYNDIPYERETKRLLPFGVPAAGRLYEISLRFKEGFDLEKYAIARYGKSTDVYKKSDDYYFYDIQWVKKTADGLVWLIRYYKGTNSLKLAGRIPGSEWAL